MSQPLLPSSWPRPVRHEFIGQHVRLRPLQAAQDASALFAASHGTPEREAIWNYLWQGPFSNAAAMQTWLGSVEASADPVFFTVLPTATQQPSGVISILNIVPEMGRAELGHIWYAPEIQRTKINTETVFLLLSHLFDELHYRRVEWKCDSRNERSRQAALRLGFSFEGIFRQHMVIKGNNRDTAWFSMLDHEWPRLKPNFQQWLYEDDRASLRLLNNSQNSTCA